MSGQQALETLVSEMFLEVKALRSEVKELRNQLGVKPVESTWMPTVEAWRPLGLASAESLRRLIRENIFSVDSGEIRNVSTGDRNIWHLNVPKCKKRLDQHFKNIRYRAG